MVALFQLFEFAYQDGFLFYDRSGALSRKLQELLPGLTVKRTTFDQRDFALPSQEIELFFGCAQSQIQTLSPGQEDFPSTATAFLQAVTQGLELSQLSEFRFRYVLGKACETNEEAQQLIWPLVPQETKEKLSTLAEPAQYRALQSEYIIKNLACQSRLAILDLEPHPRLAKAGAERGKTMPHITFQLDVRGLLPIPLTGFDAEAFMKNVSQNQAREVLEKLAPHLS